MYMETKRFTKNDESFICAHCGKSVSPLGYTSRNHCPFCLWSMHADINPGDRASDCGGRMYPVAVAPHSKKGFILTHKCERCGKVSNNKSANDDNSELLIVYTNPENIPNK